uniref:BTB domain-containing protein n=1 Tax=Oryza meridionalis TaxID=40149 RepID=A0A0E0EY41_9ORYZ
MAGDGTNPTESAIVGGTVTGHHLLHIDGYSHTKDQLPNGRCIDSRPFTVGGHLWRIGYYSNGDVADGSAYMAVYLTIDENVVVAVKAFAKFSLFFNGEPTPPAFVHTTEPFVFSKKGIGYGFSKYAKRELMEGSIVEDKFTIRCDVVVSTELRAEDRPPAPAPSDFAAVVPPSDLHRHLGDLLDSKHGADVTFQVGGEAFRAHRYVLAARSPVFRAELFGAMREATAAAAASSSDSEAIRVDDMEAPVFSALLRFVYTDALPAAPGGADDGQAAGGGSEEAAAMAQHLLVAADRYDLKRLKLLCEDKLRRHIDAASAASMLALAEQHHCRSLKEACLVFLSSPANLHAAMRSDGFEHLSRSCPGVIKELISKLVPPMPPPTTAPPFASSAIVAGAVNGHHVLRIDGYSHTKNTVRNGQHIRSCMFRAAGCSWIVYYYPNGYTAESADFISLYAELQDDVLTTAQFTVSLLDELGRPGWTYRSSSCTCKCSGSSGEEYSMWGGERFIRRDELEQSEYVRDDRLAIRFDVAVMDKLRTTEEIAGGAVPPSEMSRHFADLLASGDGADVEFRVGGETVAAHRVVLAARSRVFRAELLGPMKEGVAANGAIQVDDMDAEVFRSLLHFVYTDSLPPETGTPREGAAAMAQHLIVAADRYDLERLKLICEERLCEHIGVATAATTLELAERHHCHGLKRACMEFLSSPTNLKAAMETDGFEQLSCPAVLKELMAKALVLRLI